MQKQTLRATSLCALILIFGACSGSATKSSTPPTNPTPAIVINAPVPVSPADGTSSVGWPTLTVTNSTRTGSTGAITYRFDISAASDFSSLLDTSGAIPEGGGQTSYTSTKTPLPADQATLYWRAVAIDSQNAIQSPPSATRSFQESNPPSKAAQIAQQQGRVLWSGPVPPGDPGHAKMGNGWDIRNLVSFDGVPFLSPELDELQIFDCMDRGMSPQQAIDWLHGHGYSTQAVWYADTGSGIGVIGFPHQYIAFTGGQWDMTTRVGA